MAGKRLVQQRLDRNITELLSTITYRKMQGTEDRQAIHELHRKGFLQNFSFQEGWDGFNDDELDREINSDTYGIFVGVQLAATIRLCIITPEIPNAWALDFSGHTLKPKLAEGLVLLEVSRLVVDPRIAEQIPELPYIAFRLVAMAHIHYRTDEGYSYVRPKHVGFYCRLFNAQPEGEAFFYPPLQADFQMLTLRLNPILDKTNFRFDSFQSTYLERRQIFGRADLIPGITIDNKVAA